MRTRNALVAGLAGTSLIGLGMATANASGFQVREQSATAIANATAGASASARDVTHLNFNPASIGFIDGTEAAAAGHVILPEFRIRNVEATTTDGRPIAGGRSETGDTTGVAPAIAMKTDLNADLALGLGISAPWGLTTEYDRDWAGRFHAVDTELLTVNVNPVLAYRVSPRLSVAAGIQAQYADAKLSNKVDYGTAGAGAGVPGATPGVGQEGLATVEGDDWGFGFNLGAIYQVDERTRIGAAYHSRIDHVLTGNARFNADNPTAAQLRNGLRELGGVFTNGGGRAELDLPAVFSIGASHRISERLTLLGELTWTEWSQFDELVVEFDDNTPDSVTSQNWSNTWMVAVGADYRLTPEWTLHGGAGIDESPVPDDTRTPRIPDSDRIWLTVGASYEPAPHLTLSGSFAHVMFRDASIDLEATPTNENAARGNLRGDTATRVDIVALQATYRF